MVDTPSSEAMKQIRLAIKNAVVVQKANSNDSDADDDDAPDKKDAATDEEQDDENDEQSGTKKTKGKKRRYYATGDKAKYSSKPRPNSKKDKSKPTKKGNPIKWQTDPAAIAIMKRPASNRPSYSEKPVAYKGGKIYFAAAKKAFRVYLKKQDLVEKHVAIGEPTKDNKKHAFQYACGLIETRSK
jgi:hypothetical protein